MTDLYRRWLLELWRGDYDVAGEIVAEDFAGHWPDREVTGREELVAMIRQTREMFTTLEFRLELGPLRDGEFLIGRWTGAGTTADGGEMRLLGNDILRVRDDRLVEYWVASWAG